MIIPKDAQITADIRPEEAIFSWAPPKWDKYAYASFFWFLGLTLIPTSMVPKDFPPKPDTTSLFIGIGCVALGTLFFWLGSISRTTLRATNDQIEVIRVPFRTWRSKQFASSPIQFYVVAAPSSSGTGMNCRAICMVGKDGISRELVRGLSQTMASQIWYELQEFFELEDLEVLGEIGHQQFTEFRRTKNERSN